VGVGDRRLKPLGWIGSSYKDLVALLAAVVREIGYALSIARNAPNSRSRESPERLWRCVRFWKSLKT